MQNENQKYHAMILEKSRTSGEEEWYCPECGRRMLVRWTPKFRRVVTEPGDENALHSGSKGSIGSEGLVMGPMKAAENRSGDLNESEILPDPEVLEIDESMEVLPEDDPCLAPWQHWMQETGFAQLWDQDN